MQLTKLRAYLALQSTVILLCLLYESVWLFSKTAAAEITGYGHLSNYRRARSVNTIDAYYTVDGQDYDASYLANAFVSADGKMPVRYLIFAPSISRPDTLMGNWGLPFVVFTIFFLISTIAFLQKDIIPHETLFILSKKRPFIKLLKPAQEESGVGW
jgi:hypothetical protein